MLNLQNNFRRKHQITTNFAAFVSESTTYTVAVLKLCPPLDFYSSDCGYPHFFLLGLFLRWGVVGVVLTRILGEFAVYEEGSKQRQPPLAFQLGPRHAENKQLVEADPWWSDWKRDANIGVVPLDDASGVHLLAGYIKQLKWMEQQRTLSQALVEILWKGWEHRCHPSGGCVIRCPAPWSVASKNIITF